MRHEVITRRNHEAMACGVGAGDGRVCGRWVNVVEHEQLVGRGGVVVDAGELVEERAWRVR